MEDVYEHFYSQSTSHPPIQRWLVIKSLRFEKISDCGKILLLATATNLWVIINKSDKRNIIVQDLSQTPELIHFNSDIFSTPRSSFWGEMTLILILMALGSKLTPHMLQPKVQCLLLVSAWFWVAISQPLGTIHYIKIKLIHFSSILIKQLYVHVPI